MKCKKRRYEKELCAPRLRTQQTIISQINFSILFFCTPFTHRAYKYSSIFRVFFCTFSFRSFLMNLLSTAVSVRVCVSFFISRPINSMMNFCALFFCHTFYHKLLLHFYLEYNFLYITIKIPTRTIFVPFVEGSQFCFSDFILFCSVLLVR